MTETEFLMSDVDRYITDEAVRELVRVLWYSDEPDDGERMTAEDYLRAVLPGILAQHRQDVLREAAIQLQRELMEKPLEGRNTRADWAVNRLYQLADEATP